MNWDVIKTAVATFLSAFLASLQPVYDAMLLLLIFAGCDMLFGLLAGLVAGGERFSFKKFILAAGYLLVYLGVVVLIYAVGRFQDDALAAHYLVKVVTYVFIYFYSSNMFRNLHLLMPGNPVIRFLDYFVGLQFVRRVPVLEEFLQRAEQEKVSGADAASRNFSSVSAEDTPEDTCGTVDERPER